MRVASAAVALGLTATPLGAAGAPAASTARPHTLVLVRGNVQGFAQDSSRIAWLTATEDFRHCAKTLHIRSLVTRHSASTRQAGCFGSEDSARLALAGRAAVWDLLTAGGNTELDLVLFTAAAGERRAHRIAAVHIDREFGYPDPYPAVAGAGNMLAYSVPTGVRRVVRGRTRRLFDFVNPLSVAVGGGRLVVVRQELRTGDGCGCAIAPSWTPDGRVAFLSTDVPDTVAAEITLVGATGSGRTLVTHDGLWRFDLDWSADGTKLAYSYFKRDGGVTIAVAAPDGSGARDLVPGDQPAWSQDGTKIAFTLMNAGSTQVFVMDADGGNVRQLTATPSPGSAAPSWSPDGSHIAYADGFTRRISVMDADGGNQHALERVGYDPDWSPDGRQIAYASAAQPGGIWVADADGANPRRLTTGPDADPHWSFDGKTIVFSSSRTDIVTDDDTAHELYLIDADGSHLRPLTFTVAPAWLTRGQVRTVRGRVLSRLEAAGITAGVAVAGNGVVVLTRDQSGQGRLSVFDARTGAQRSSTALAGNFPVLGGANARWVVFRTGAKTIRALDLRTLKPRTLLIAPVTPFGLSVSGRRVAWVENAASGKSARIRALTLPR